MSSLTTLLFPPFLPIYYEFKMVLKFPHCINLSD